MKEQLLIFDCDGTILDTFKLIEQSTIRTFKEVLPHIDYTIEQIHAFFGPLLEESFSKYTTNDEELMRCVSCYRYYNKVLHPQYVKAYDHIKEELIKLKQQGYYLTVLSNKTTAFVELGLQIAGVLALFDEIIGVDKMPVPKPDPSGLVMLMEKYQTAEAIFFGDTVYDILCGKNAQKKYPDIITVGVTWCQTSRDTLKKEGANIIIDSPLEITKVVEENGKI